MQFSDILTSSSKSHLNLLHHSIAKHTRAVNTMAPITITNSTSGEIQVRITNYEDQGSSDFFPIASGEPAVWQRDHIQSMTVFRSDNPVPDVLIVNPKETHNIQ
ncbi:uncharacterized protein EDB91DRAFT_1243675 [Suillus paluster]|uniref:uncharacterized protein n=1 Tax=Suillus paluster TaxID=48578 RepID=UPI001B874530|nr:uncharacterized protein EDB91DRAFT_1243675 [Suillus paluster]KAG1751407.1 hypothetical protein EDB91DRAFT_1243675 [Suillus paluster]